MSNRSTGEPVWLAAALEARVETLGGAVLLGQAAATEAGVVMATLTEPPEHATPAQRDRWERTCDNCGAHCPGTFYTGTAARLTRTGVQVIITFGVCPACKDLS
jgi:hypothetical protein